MFSQHRKRLTNYYNSAAMTPQLFSLPFELRLHVWELVIGPEQIRPCECPSKPGTCIFNHPGGCCESFNVYRKFDNRILRVCRQIHDEVHPVLVRTPKRFMLCNGLCLENFLLRIKPRDRRWIQQIRVKLYVGDVATNTLEDQSGEHLLRKGEASCGGFVRSALGCQGVGSLVAARPVAAIEEDNIGRRVLCVDLVLK